MGGEGFFLVSRRVGFRRWRADDLPLAVGLWGDERVTRLIDARGRLSSAQVEARLASEVALELQSGVQYWPIFLREGGAHLGCCGLRPYKPRVLEFGVHLRADCWGKGYASEAARAVMGYGFDVLGCEALFAGHNPRNEGSAALLKKLGFRYTHDEHYAPTGLEHPSYLLTAQEYRAMKAAAG